MREIPLDEMIALYEEGLLLYVVVVKDRVYGKSVKGQAGNPRGLEVVWAKLPP